jgi:hypothetical protein
MIDSFCFFRFIGWRSAKKTSGKKGKEAFLHSKEYFAYAVNP